jgi:hypothetical protein
MTCQSCAKKDLALQRIVSRHEDGVVITESYTSGFAAGIEWAANVARAALALLAEQAIGAQEGDK